MSTQQTHPDAADANSDESAVAEFAEVVLTAALGATQMQAIYLGDRLGWYRALADLGPLTPGELARRTGTHERYAREWLEHQAINGYLTVDGDRRDDANPADASRARRYRLPFAHAQVLVDADSLAYMSPLARFNVATCTRMPELLDAYRTGGGVSWEQLGPDAREAQATMSRPMFLHQLCQEFLPAIGDLHERLTAGARVADVGCGEAWSAVGIALGYPLSAVDGFDIDRPSLEAGRRHAAEHGVQDRVHLTELDATKSDGMPETDMYDAVFAFECVHDVSDPVALLTTMRRIARPGAPVIVMDERTGTDFDPAAGLVEQLLYGFSLTVCLPDGMSHQPSAATGTVMRPAKLAEYAVQAGFSRVETLPIEHDLLRFYRLHG